MSPPRATLKISGVTLALPATMGIVNVTPDSFSDGGLAATPDKAVAHATALVAQGASILDIGAESTRPGAPAVSEAEERRRLLPALEALQAADLGIPLSIDTRRPAVAALAVSYGVRVLNDISAQTDPAMLALALRTPGCALVMMHGYDHHTGACGCAAHANAPDVVFASLFGRAAAAASAGLPEHSIWLDPGFGFGKSPEENVAILRTLTDLCTGPYPVVVGPSRKRFLHVLTAAHRQGGSNGSFDADSATAEACEIARQQGASVLRVHRPESARAEVPN